jgi:hypothetical protein
LPFEDGFVPGHGHRDACRPSGDIVVVDGIGGRIEDVKTGEIASTTSSNDGELVGGAEGINKCRSFLVRILPATELDCSISSANIKKIQRGTYWSQSEE